MTSVKTQHNIVACAQDFIVNQMLPTQLFSSFGKLKDPEDVRGHCYAANRVMATISSRGPLFRVNTTPRIHKDNSQRFIASDMKTQFYLSLLAAPRPRPRSTRKIACALILIRSGIKIFFTIYRFILVYSCTSTRFFRQNYNFSTLPRVYAILSFNKLLIDRGYLCKFVS